MYIRKLKNILESILLFPSKRVQIYKGHYSEFGILILSCIFINYFLYNQELSFGNQSFNYNFLSATSCFFLIAFSNINLGEYFKDKILPFYWHFTLFITLPFHSTIFLLFSYFNTPWIVNSAVTMLILALLVDLVSFLVIYISGVFIAYIVYIIHVDNVIILYTEKNIDFLVYVYIFSFILTTFFLYQKDKITIKIQKINEDLEDQIQARTKSLEEALKIKSEFLNTISHEIRTPIQGIVGIAGELYSQWDILDNGERYYLAQIIANSGNRLIDLVSNILDMSKLEFAKISYSFYEYDIIEFVQSIVNEFKPESIKKNISIILDTEFKVYNIIFDKDRMKQVLRNILSNSLKFSDKGIIRINIIKNDDLTISVCDEGIGIPDSELQDIFKPFIQSSRTKLRSGSSGLGLSIACEIIKAHNGKIWAEKVDNGSKICYIIGKLNKSNNEIIEIRDENNENNSIFNNQKILFIDDEEACRLGGKLILQGLGLSVVTAENGIEALDILEINHNFDIIIADLMMPGMDGLELIKRIKQKKELKNIPIILQTGTSEQKIINSAKSFGAVECILKPYNKESIISVIKKFL
jgi:signal transduction histidine kinase